MNQKRPFAKLLLICLTFAGLIGFGPRSLSGSGAGDRVPQEEVKIPEISTPRVEHLVDVGGRKLHCFVYGSGSPTVVLSSGLSAPQEYWNTVIPELAAKATVLTYDRAGVGKSEIGSLPADGGQSAKDLHILLGKLSAPKPYILVGHSFGGMIVRLFASAYPDDLGGLILEDSQHEDNLIELKRILRGKDLEAFNELLGDRFITPENPKTEADYREMTREKLRQSKPLPRIPLVVLTSAGRAKAMGPMFSAEAIEKMEEMDTALNEKLAALIPGGKLIIVEGTGHNIHMDKPQAVIAPIMEMIKSAREKGSPQARGQKEADQYEHWLKEEVKLLITPEEEAAFKKLSGDEERERFIELFWTKRDPSPGSQENEFKDEWYKRLDYVTKKYSSGSVSKGWHTDMGRVYMIFGPPFRVRAGAGGPKADPSGGTQIEAPPEMWMYQPMPALGLNSAFTITFRNYQYGYDLDQQTPQSIHRAMEIFPKVVLFSPDLKEVPAYKYALEENSAEGKMIKQFMTAGQEARQIPLEWRPIFTRALGGSTYVTLLVQIDPQTMDRKKLKEVTFFGRLTGEGEEVQDFLQTVKLESEKAAKLVTAFGFPARPGKSILYLGAEDKGKQSHTLLKSDLDVQDFGNEELVTSSLILSSQIVSKSPEDAKEEFSPYITNDYKATPRWENVFKPDEFMSVLFHVYNAKIREGEVDLTIDYFVTSQGVSYRLNPQTIRAKTEEGKTVAGGTEIPLAPLKPGPYTFKVKVTDKVANKAIEKMTEFVVE
jgi:GWxTD domain-containing protein